MTPEREMELKGRIGLLEAVIANSTQTGEELLDRRSVASGPELAELDKRIEDNKRSVDAFKRLLAHVRDELKTEASKQ